MPRGQVAQRYAPFTYTLKLIEHKIAARNISRGKIHSILSYPESKMKSDANPAWRHQLLKGVLTCLTAFFHP